MKKAKTCITEARYSCWSSLVIHHLESSLVSPFITIAELIFVTTSSLPLLMW